MRSVVEQEWHPVLLLGVSVVVEEHPVRSKVELHCGIIRNVFLIACEDHSSFPDMLAVERINDKEFVVRDLKQARVYSV